MEGYGWLPKNWSDWAALFQILQFFIIVAALAYAKGQADEAARARKLAATQVLFNELGAQDVRELRSWVLERVDWPQISDSNEEDLRRIRRLSVAYDRVGYMIQEGLLPDRALFEFQQDEIEELWKRVEPSIDLVRRNNRPHYCRHFSIWLRTGFHGHVGATHHTNRISD